MTENATDSSNKALFTLSGNVIHGNHLGEKLGFPTANLDIEFGQELNGKLGVYAVLVHLKDKIYPGMANIGYKPTLKESSFSVEIHLIDFSGSLYGEKLIIDFCKKIRNEMKFNSLQQLTEQMKRDKETAKEILSGFFKADTNPA